jgi:hypothetical protein
MDSQELSQRTDDVFQLSADQHHATSGTDELLDLLHSGGIEVRTKHITKVFLSQQIEAISTHAAQWKVEHPRGQLSASQTSHRPQQHSHAESQQAVGSLTESLGVQSVVNGYAQGTLAGKPPLNGEKDNLLGSIVGLKRVTARIQIGTPEK